MFRSAGCGKCDDVNEVLIYLIPVLVKCLHLPPPVLSRGFTLLGTQPGVESEGKDPGGKGITQTWIHFLASVTLGNLPEARIEQGLWVWHCAWHVGRLVNHSHYYHTVNYYFILSAEG